MENFVKFEGVNIMFLKDHTSYEECRQYIPALTLSEYNKAFGIKSEKKKLSDKKDKTKLSDKSKA